MSLFPLKVTLFLFYIYGSVYLSIPMALYISTLFFSRSSKIDKRKVKCVNFYKLYFPVTYNNEITTEFIVRVSDLVLHHYI